MPHHPAWSARLAPAVAAAPSVALQSTDITILRAVNSPAAPFRLGQQPTEPEILAKYFRGFGDPTRLRILELVSEREHAVGELVERVGATQPQVSNHLACLRWCGFVDTRREHRTVYYRVADDRVAQIIALARALLAQNEDHVAACRRIDA